MKKFIWIVLLLVLLIAGAAWYFVSFRLDDMIRTQIEESGSAALGTRVSVGSLHTDLKKGVLTIASISVANPEGYENEYAFSLNGIQAAVDYQTREVRRVVISRPDIVIEEHGGQTNFNELLDNIERDDPAAESDPNDPEPVIVIHHFRMDEARAAFESRSLDRFSEVKVKRVELNELKGTPTELSREILEEIVEQVVSAAAVELIKAKASEKLNDLLGRD